MYNIKIAYIRTHFNFFGFFIFYIPVEHLFPTIKLLVETTKKTAEKNHNCY